MTVRKIFLLGVRDTLPLMAGAAPFGLIFGALGAASDLGPMATLGMSLFVFAGSAQFVAANLVAQQATVIVILVTTLLVNARHMLYGPTLRPHLHDAPRPLMALLAFFLTDETFAVAIGHFTTEGTSKRPGIYMLGSSLAMYINWQLWTIIGIVLGSQVEGLGDIGEFAMVVTFIGIAVPMITTSPMVVCALVAGGSAFLLAGLPYNAGLIIASVLGLAAGIGMETLRNKEAAA